MPSILLINDNKIVSRLLQLSSEKNGYNLEEVTILDNSGGSYDVVFIDSDRYSDELMREIESKLKYGKLGYIGVKQETVPEGFDIVIEKPFLPTDFVDIIKEQVIGSISEKEETFDEDENLEMESLDLDDEADVLLDEDSLDLESFDDDVEDLLVSDDDQNDEISLDDLDALDDVDLSLDPATVMTTGVAASMAMSDNNPEELADMVSELEDMNEDELKPLDEEIVLESEPEVELESESQKPLDMDSEDFEDDISELTREATELEESKEGISGLEVAAGAAAVVGAVASGAIASTDSLEVVEDKDIEKEVSKLDDLVELNEADLQQALGEEVTEVAEETAEEIISEEIISDGEETMVESNEVEKWIRDAVAKAITPEMIKEALDGMDINVTLNFSSKKEDDATS
jgi:uncharacterized membrane protein